MSPLKAGGGVGKTGPQFSSFIYFFFQIGLYFQVIYVSKQSLFFFLEGKTFILCNALTASRFVSSPQWVDMLNELPSDFQRGCDKYMDL